MLNLFRKKCYQKDSIPAPIMFKDSALDPFQDTHPDDLQPVVDVYYATDRKKITKNQALTYSPQRDDFLRLGKAAVRLGPEGKSWEWIARQSLLSKRNETLQLAVTGINEFGSLWTTHPYPQTLELENDIKQQSQSFAQDINQKLQRSKNKNIYIYVSGFKVCFEDPVLLTRSFWHYMGYDGVFISYSWPATAGRLLSYAHDLETTQYCSRNLRLLIDFLAQSTDAEEIHIIGHSAGTRIVCNALKELRLINSSCDEKELRTKLKIGHVVLIGADFDRMILKSYYRDNILDLLRKVTLYMSRKDRALKFSRFIFKGARLGALDKRNLSDLELKVLRQEMKVDIIDVTGARKATSGSGHLYHMTSPWVSSDIINCVKNDLSPQDRGLQKKDNSLVWSFKE